MKGGADWPGLIPAYGGYRKLASFQMAEIVYDATVAFCNRFVDKRSRTHDQMVQAARSGKQNISEGCMVSGTSKKSELKLIGVARGSLEELLQDYEDYLVSTGWPCGRKTAPRQGRYAVSATRQIGHIRPIGPMSSLLRRRRPQIL